MNLRKLIYQVRQQMDLLEAIGLLKAFVKHDEQETQFVYQLIQPPSAHLFFNDPDVVELFVVEVEHRRFHG